MAAIPREVKEGPQKQGVDEQIYYLLTTTPWGSSPGAVSVAAYDYSQATDAYTDVTATVLSGAASVSGDVITLPVLKSLTEDHLYRVEIKFTCSGNVFEAYVWVQAER